MNIKEIDIKLMQEYVEYNSTTGALTYKISGKQARDTDRDGYIRVCVRGKKYQAHRVAWVLHNEENPSHQIDHINGDKQDNRIDNLRQATSQQQCANKPSKGIGRKQGKWRAQTKYNGKHIHIGLYECPLIAHIAYTDKMRELHGQYARR